MPVWSFVLRVLLSLCLLVNGAAAATMHVHASSWPGASAESAGHAAGMAAPDSPCHGMTDTAAGQAEESTKDPGTPDGSTSPDCCQSGTCRCACLPLTPPLSPAMQLGRLVHGPDRGTHSLPQGHASPILAHPIRPPIS
ncbi:MAG TPA: CopL family metal-binding regulatory protein [Gemmatimonadaceae bacterium]